MRRTLIISLLLFLFLLFLIVVVSSLIVGERTSFFGKASTGITEGEVSAENSYLFASPLSAAAQNTEKIRVTVFLLNNKGLGVSGKKVTLGNENGINVQEVQPVTDSYGKAVFDINATNAGEYLLEARVDTTVLPQKVKVSFR